MNHKKQCFVIGGGGHAKVVIRGLQESGWQVVGVFDDDMKLAGQSICNVPVQGPVSAIDSHPRLLTVVAVGNNQTRRMIVERSRLDWLTVIHPSAVVDSTVTLEPGTVVMAGSVIQPDTYIGAHSIINTSSSIDHDCRLGDYCHVAPGAHLPGQCELGNGVLVGVGSSMKPMIRVGEWTVIGVGSVVVKNLPAGVTAYGNPAKIHTQAP